MSRGRYSMRAMSEERVSNGAGASAPSLLRVHEVRKSRRRWKRSDRATAAVMHGLGDRTRKRSAQRPKGAKAPGIVTGTAKTAQRASWSRAGRSRARRNRARRPVRRTGRAPLPCDRNSGRYRAVIHSGWRRPACRKGRGLASQDCEGSVGDGVECDERASGNRGRCRWRRAKHGGDEPSAGRRADALRTEVSSLERKHRRACGDGAPAPSRTRGRGGGVWRDSGAGSASGSGAKRRAATRDTWHGAKGGPIPRRSEGPALKVRGSAAVTQRRS